MGTLMAWCLAAVLVLSLASRAGSVVPPPEARSSGTSITFMTAVELPGMTLPPGAYLFEHADPALADLVRVSRQRGGSAYVTAMTRRVRREQPPRGGSEIVVDRSAGRLPRVRAWFPRGGGHGHAFVYD